ncbi:MAG: Nif3-like dinuclear metal center hexameric protein, partial [Ktedonobacterales bacterium]|nr:Nif3-like dinuclear metal center hexameric protein [Ktedonobacterales bacterium]
ATPPNGPLLAAPTPTTTRAVTPEEKRQMRAAARRRSRAALPPKDEGPRQPAASTSSAPRRRAANHPAPVTAPVPPPAIAHVSASRVSASRDEIVRFLDEYLQIGRFRDLGPNGLQVIGAPEVRRVALGVSANLALFEAAAARGADLIAAHHGLFLDRDARPILARLKRRLVLLFQHDITLLGYHLPLDAHAEIGNNVQWLRRLGFAIETTEFAPYHGQYVGAIGVREAALPFAALVEGIASLAGGTPRVYHHGPGAVRRLAVVTGGAPGSLTEAVERGCDAYLTGEVAEDTQALAQEEGANFIAAGHYNTERFGIQALGALLSQRFGIETFFIEIPNEV